MYSLDFILAKLENLTIALLVGIIVFFGSTKIVPTTLNRTGQD